MVKAGNILALGLGFLLGVTVNGFREKNEYKNYAFVKDLKGSELPYGVHTQQFFRMNDNESKKFRIEYVKNLAVGGQYSNILRLETIVIDDTGSENLRTLQFLDLGQDGIVNLVEKDSTAIIDGQRKQGTMMQDLDDISSDQDFVSGQYNKFVKTLKAGSKW